MGKIVFHSFIFFLLGVFICSGLSDARRPISSTGDNWCVAKPTAPDAALQTAINYACGTGGADCSAIQPGGKCFNPNTLHDHASYAFNQYYHKNPSSTSCDFGGAAMITNVDPSSGECQYS